MTTVFKVVRRRRFAAALALAVIYALCVLAPHAAVALGADPHCLKDVPVAAHVHAAKAEPHEHAMHQHGDGMRQHGADTVHRHSNGLANGLADSSVPKQSDTNDKNHAATCCGLFCLTAIALDVAVMLPPPPPPVTLAALGRDEAHAGRGPIRINRPPIA
jgi:hypothetical protein